MNVASVQQLYDYSYWANTKLFAVIAELTDEQFTQAVAGSYGSIRNTLVHAVSAEWGWLDRCGGPPRGERLRPDDYPNLASVEAIWNRVERDMRAFLGNLTDDDLARPIEFAIGSGPKQILPMKNLLVHGVVHTGHHRGQIALLLRTLGFAPGNLDFLVYALERESASGNRLPHASTA